MLNDLHEMIHLIYVDLTSNDTSHIAIKCDLWLQIYPSLSPPLYERAMLMPFRLLQIFRTSSSNVFFASLVWSRAFFRADYLRFHQIFNGFDFQKPTRYVWHFGKWFYCNGEDIPSLNEVSRIFEVSYDKAFSKRFLNVGCARAQRSEPTCTEQSQDVSRAALMNTTSIMGTTQCPPLSPHSWGLPSIMEQPRSHSAANKTSPVPRWPYWAKGGRIASYVARNLRMPLCYALAESLWFVSRYWANSIYTIITMVVAKFHVL